jgi:Fe-S cluster assembly ATPase SufC
MKYSKWRCWNQNWLFDETDSGLDIDALRIVANGVNKLKMQS